MAESREIGKIYTTFEVKGVEQVERKLKGVEEQSKKTDEKIISIGKNIAGAFAVGSITNFIVSAVELSAKLEGIERGFKALNKPDLLNNLRNATKGTVSDLELMQSAVKASNFRIPLEEMGKLLEFAQSRARQTGESVDYLVESIVTGIGRKSPLILDNLGISAVELKEKLNGVGLESASVGDITKAVGEIANNSLILMGNQSLTTADKIAQIGATWDNIKTSIGKAATELGIFIFDAIMGLNQLEIMQNTMMRNALDKAREDIAKTQADINTQASNVAEAKVRGKNIEGVKKLIDVAQRRIILMKDEGVKTQEQIYELSGLTAQVQIYRQRLNELMDLQGDANEISKSKIQLLQEEIINTKNISNEELRRIGIKERELALVNKINNAVKDFTSKDVVSGKGTDKFSKTITSPKELTGVEAIEKTALLGESLSFTGKLIQDLEYGVDSFADSLSSGFARAIMGANSFNEALKNSLNLLGEIALKSLFASAIGSISGGGSGLLGMLFGGSSSTVASGSSGIVGGLDKINNSIQAQTFNSMANKQAPVIVINSQIDGVKFTKGTTLPATNKISKGGLNVNNL
jgi:hypothetical protein